MRKLVISSLVFFVFLVGCSNDEAYHNAIQKGLDYIASEAYQKAESAFELALDEKKDDEKATALLNQTVHYQEALQAMEDEDFDIAKEEAQNVIKIENGSSALIKKSEEIVTSIKDLETSLSEVTEEYEAALKQFEDNKYNEADKLVDDILKNALDQPIFKSINKKINTLQEDIKSALTTEKEDKEKKAKAEKDKAEKEKKEKEQAESNNSANSDKDIFYERGYAVYYDEYDMMIDAETGEVVLNMHPMFEPENIEAVLSWIEHYYEPGMTKDELKNTMYGKIEVSDELVGKGIDIYWSENF